MRRASRPEAVTTVLSRPVAWRSITAERSSRVHHDPGWWLAQPRNTFRALEPLSQWATAQATSGALPVSPIRRSPFHSTVSPGMR